MSLSKGVVCKNVRALAKLEVIFNSIHAVSRKLVNNDIYSEPHGNGVTSRELCI